MTGLVSPQYNCRFDDFFDTIQHNRPDVVMSATWKQMAGLHRVDGTPTASEPSETTSDAIIPQMEQLETVQNDSIEFVHDFEPNNDVTDIADAPDIPMQASEGDTMTNQGLLVLA